MGRADSRQDAEIYSWGSRDKDRWDTRAKMEKVALLRFLDFEFPIICVVFVRLDETEIVKKTRKPLSD